MLSAQAEPVPKNEDSLGVAHVSVKDWQEAVAAAGYTFIGPRYTISTASSSSPIITSGPKK
jgi:hypothetical protein